MRGAYLQPTSHPLTLPCALLLPLCRTSSSSFTLSNPRFVQPIGKWVYCQQQFFWRKIHTREKWHGHTYAIAYCHVINYDYTNEITEWNNQKGDRRLSHSQCGHVDGFHTQTRYLLAEERKTASESVRDREREKDERVWERMRVFKRQKERERRRRER